MNFEFDDVDRMHEYRLIGAVVGHVLVYSYNRLKHDYSSSVVDFASRLSVNRMLALSIHGVQCVIAKLT